MHWDHIYIYTGIDITITKQGSMPVEIYADSKSITDDCQKKQNKQQICAQICTMKGECKTGSSYFFV